MLGNAENSDDKSIDVVRKIIDQRKLKLKDLAVQIGLPYSSLQNYMYKRTRMPLYVYLDICEQIGITPDYPVNERFKLDHHSLQKAILDVFGGDIYKIQVDSDSCLTVGEDSAKTMKADKLHDRRVAGFLAHAIASKYDLIRELDLLDSLDDTENDAG